MKIFSSRSVVVIGFCLFAISSQAQVPSINSVKLEPRFWNDIPGATIVTAANYPSQILFYEVGVSAPTGWANRDLWRFSNDGGATAYAFGNNDFFQASMTLTLTGTPISPRKEAGFILNSIGGDGQFIVNTDSHEVVAFGGPFPFYAFPSTFDSGETITLGLHYFLNGDGKRAIIYTANGVSSPPLEFTNLEQGIIDGSTLGGYFQIVSDPANPFNGGSALFQNITIVPEPSTLALLSVGLLGLLARRRG